MPGSPETVPPTLLGMFLQLPYPNKLACHDKSFVIPLSTPFSCTPARMPRRGGFSRHHCPLLDGGPTCTGSQRASPLRPALGLETRSASLQDLLRCSRLAPDERKLECRKGPEHSTLPTETNLAAHKFTTHRNVLHETYFKKRKTYITFCM